MENVALQDNITVLPITAQTKTFSVWELFWGAEPIVQLIMLGLVVVSVWSWAVIFFKFQSLRQANKDADEFEESFWSGGSLDELFERINNQPRDPMSAAFCAAMKEWRRSISKGALRSTDLAQTLQARIERVMDVTVNREIDTLEQHMGFLASTGSTAVFVGLFGTVLGIIHSFESIAAQQNTNLAVVAPGIAEALFATALGLVAAIPAVIAYNKLSNELNRYTNRLDGFMAEFSSLISRQLEDAA